MRTNRFSLVAILSLVLVVGNRASLEAEAGRVEEAIEFDAVETITPMLDPDGQWRVSGYFIK